MKYFISTLILLFSTNAFCQLNTPGPTFPLDKATNLHTSTSLQCSVANSTNAPANYQFELDTTSNFNSSLLDRSGGSQYLAFINPRQIRKANTDLLYGTTYYWRVRAVNSSDTSQWSSVRTFTTLDTLSLFSPANNSTNENTSRSLRVAIEEFNVKPANYVFELDTTPSFNSTEFLRSNGDQYSAFTTPKQMVNLNSNLLYGTKYYWRARATNANDSSQWSPIWSFTTLDTISVFSPANNSMNENTSRSLRVAIEEVNIAPANYVFELDTTPNFNSTQFSRSKGDQYSAFSKPKQIVNLNSGLLYGTKYFWRARATNAKDSSQWSSVRTFTTLDTISLISPANNSRNENTSRSLRVAIEEVNETPGNYVFELDTTPNFNSTLLQSSNGDQLSAFTKPKQIAKLNSDLLYGTKYYWRARATNANDSSQWSTVWSFTTLDSIALVSPSNKAVDVAIDAVLSVDVEESRTGPADYVFQIHTSADFTSNSVQKLPGSSYSISFSEIRTSRLSLRYGTKYYWRALSKNKNDSSQWSKPWSFTTAYQLKVAPTLVSPKKRDTVIASTGPTFKWNGITSASSYTLQYSTDSTFETMVTSVNASGLTTTLNGLSSGTSYYWRVRGNDAFGSSPWSSAWKVITAFELPTAPILVSPSNGGTINAGTSQTFEWNASTRATGYTMQYSTDSTFASVVTSINESGLTTDVSSLVGSTTYFWRVRGTNTYGNSPWSSVWKFTTADQLPAAPTLVAPSNGATINAGTNQTFEWNASARATGHTMQYSTDSTFASVVTSINESGLTTDVSSLVGSTSYFWRVRGTNTFGNSPWSSVWKFTTADQLPTIPTLVSPSNLAIINPTTSQTFEWNASTRATGYTMQYSTDSNFASVVVSINESGLTADINGLANNTTYFWRVRGTNTFGTSPWSTVWKFSTETPTVINNDFGAQLNIHPNPTSGLVFVELKDYHQEVLLVLSNSQGQVVSSQVFYNQKNLAFELREEPGLYFLSIYADNAYLLTEKLIKD